MHDSAVKTLQDTRTGQVARHTTAGHRHRSRTSISDPFQTKSNHPIFKQTFFMNEKICTRQSFWVETEAFPWRVGGSKVFLRVSYCAHFVPCGLPLFQLSPLALFKNLLVNFFADWYFDHRKRREFSIHLGGLIQLEIFCTMRLATVSTQALGFVQKLISKSFCWLIFWPPKKTGV